MQKIIISRIILVGILLTLLGLGYSYLPVDTKSQEWSATIIDYGVYKIQDSIHANADNIRDRSAEARTLSLTSQTDRIQGELSSAFGFRYIISGPEEEIEVTIRILHPDTLYDPITQTRFNESEWKERISTQSLGEHAAWLFEDEAEIIPGEWKIQVLLGEDILAEKSFFIQK